MKIGEMSPELIEYLRQRLENHSFSITHKKIPLKFGGEACIDKDEITIPFINELNRDTIELVYAMQIHESAHSLFSTTDFESLKRVIEANNLNQRKAVDLWNQMEDYRVNTLVSVTHPGAGRLFHKVNKKIIEKLPPKTRPQECLLLELENHEYKRMFSESKELDKAVELSRGIIGCIDMEETLKLLPEIYKIFYPDSEGGEGEEDVSGEPKSGSFGRGFTDPTQTDKEVERHIKKALEKMVKEKKITKPSKDGTLVKSGKDGIKEETDEFRDMEKTLEKAIEIQTESEIRDAKTYTEMKRIEDDIYKETKHLLKNRRVSRNEMDSTYSACVKKYGPEIRELEKQIKKTFLFRRGYQTKQTYGKLDPKRVHRVITNGDTKVFRKKNEMNTLGDIAICVLIDESGSMFWGTMEKYARETAIVLHETFRKLGIRHMIVGYTGDCHTVDIYHEIFKSWDDVLPSYNLVEIKHQAENRDGDSIRTAVHYFKLVNERRKLLIIISDGLPEALGYKGKPAIKDTIEAQRDAKKKGIKLINVGIGPGWSFPDGYYNKVRVPDVSKLPEKLMLIAKKEIVS